ncbi:EcsC family protein [Schinkia sp. CFF1]
MESFETKESLSQQLQVIEKWERDQKGLWFWEKLGRLPFQILDRLTPKFIHEKVGQILDELGFYVQTGGRYLVSEKNICKNYAKKLSVDAITIPEIARQPIQTMNEVASSYIKTTKNIAMAQGATTGIGGFLTLSIDIPILLGLSLKALQEIAICYGFDPNERNERIFIVKCLQFASSDIVGKKAILDELSAYDSDTEASARNQTISQLQGWREVMMTYRDNFGWKKLFQMIPVVGMVFGAFINKSTIEDVAEVGMMLYQKRRILHRLQIGEEESSSSI